ncbi:MAG: stage V sporulation protein AD [Christensenellales bacterium]
MDKKIGSTLFFSDVKIAGTSSIGGPREGEGPFGDEFDSILKDDELGQKSFEKAECKLHTYAIKHLLFKTKLAAEEIDCILAGDLMDEIVGASYTAKEFPTCFLGLYNACATFGEALILGACLIDGGFMRRVICSSSSHFSTAERQFRFPLELGNQRSPLAQWTVTGAGATLLSASGGKVGVTCATIGKVIDYGITDADDMGAAMAPSARDTLINHIKDTKRDLDYYDLIATGDLGRAGANMLKILMEKQGYRLGENYHDCGAMIFDRKDDNVKQGGSGTGCSNIVFNGHIYKKMIKNEYKKVLLMPTGALLSKTSTLQKQTIPAITHAVAIEVI